MKRLILPFMLAILGSCTTVYVGAPRVHRQQETAERPARTGSSTYTLQSPEVSETASVSDEVVAITPEMTAPAATTGQSPSQESSAALPVENDDSTYISTEEEQEIYEEAVRSEKTAKAAQVFSFMPLASILLPLSLLVGIIGTIVCVAKFNKYEYVTEEGVRRKKKAIRTVIICSLIPIAVVVSIIAFSLLIF